MKKILGVWSNYIILSLGAEYDIDYNKNCDRISISKLMW